MDPKKPMSHEEGNVITKDRLDRIEVRVALIEEKLNIGFRNKLISFPKIGEQIATDIVRLFPDEKSLKDAIAENRLPFKKKINEVLIENFK